MSVLFETTGIVLSWRAYKEHDRWYSAFTKEQGKIEFVARGGQKALAKLTPHLEMTAETNLLVVSGRQYYTVAGVDRLRAFPEIYNDLTRTSLAQSALALVDMGTRAHEADQDIYDLLLTWLQFLNQTTIISAERAGFLLTSFTLKFLSLIGYHPELHDCLACRKIISAGLFRWHALKGGVVCLNCVGEDSQQWFAARPMKDEALKLLRFSLQQDFASQLKPHLLADTLLSFHEAVESLLVAHFPVIPAASIREACAHC